MTISTRRSFLTQAAAWVGAAACAPAADPPAGFATEQKPDRLVITHAGQPVATYVVRDPKILRPYFAHVHAPGPIPVTRPHPPVPGADATDHDTMHPGLWLAFGDVSGLDFWRNRAAIAHVRFADPPAVRDGQLTFTALDTLQTPRGEPVGRMTSRFRFAARPAGWLLTWDATFTADPRELVFGDQEEMGLGVRLASPLTEKNGGTLRTSTGATGAKATWGRTALWSDGSGLVRGRRAGILLMPDPANFRPSWFHNRDYGLMVANPFGRHAFTGAAKSAVVVKAGDSLRLRFGLLLHAAPPAAAPGRDVDLAAEYAHFLRTLTP